MSALQLNKQVLVIPKGESESKPVYTKGARIRYLGYPTNPDGSIAMTSKSLTIEASFDGKVYHSVNDFIGAPVSVAVKGTQTVISTIGLATSPAILPVRDGMFCDGFQMLRVRSNAPEALERSIEVYFE